MLLIQDTHTSCVAEQSPASMAARAEKKAGMAPSLVLLLAAGAGLSVASLYYSQPMLGILAADIQASDRMIGLVPTLTQLGYALGILLLAPLGDRYDRRTIILWKAVLLAGALLLSGMAPGVTWLLATSLMIGVTATMAQDIVPAAATLAPDAQRGKMVGTVMTGLLLGILLSRVISGFSAEQFGWRSVYVAAAFGVGMIAVAIWRGVPRIRPTTDLKYTALMGSMIGLWRRHKALRQAAYAQGLLSVGFSAFWSTLAVMLHQAPFHLGSTVAGLFGLAGAAGALAAPFAGRLADRRGPELVARLGAGLAAIAFAAMLCAPWLSPHAQLVLILVGTIGFDFGVQATLIAHQTMVYGVDHSARSRLNALLFTGMFIGMASGAALGSLVLAQYGWSGLVMLATLSSLGALAVRVLAARRD